MWDKFRTKTTCQDSTCPKNGECERTYTSDSNEPTYPYMCSECRKGLNGVTKAKRNNTRSKGTVERVPAELAVPANAAAVSRLKIDIGELDVYTKDFFFDRFFTHLTTNVQLLRSSYSGFDQFNLGPLFTEFKYEYNGHITSAMLHSVLNRGKLEKYNARTGYDPMAIAEIHSWVSKDGEDVREWSISEYSQLVNMLTRLTEVIACASALQHRLQLEGLDNSFFNTFMTGARGLIEHVDGEKDKPVLSVIVPLILTKGHGGSLLVLGQPAFTSSEAEVHAIVILPETSHKLGQNGLSSRFTFCAFFNVK